MNAKEGRIIWLNIKELGHPQPPTPMHCDNVTSAGIANGSVKQQRSRLTEIRYFYICDQVKNGEFYVIWHPGKENTGEYASKHHDARHHQNVQALYLHKHNSPHELPWAAIPRDLKGCVGNFPGGYVRGLPLPLFPLIISPAAGTVWVFRMRAIARTCTKLARTCLCVELSYCTFSVYGLHHIICIYVVMRWRTPMTTQAHACFASSLDIPRPLIN